LLFLKDGGRRCDSMLFCILSVFSLYHGEVA